VYALQKFYEDLPVKFECNGKEIFVFVNSNRVPRPSSLISACKNLPVYKPLLYLSLTFTDYN
jgi:hypothetical protein